MQLSASIFKAYDIRGIVPATINEEVAEALGRAFGTVALREGEKTVAIGRDGRLSGAALAAALKRGLVSVGLLAPVGKLRQCRDFRSGRYEWREHYYEQLH